MVLVVHRTGDTRQFSVQDEAHSDWRQIEATVELIRATGNEIGGKVSHQCVRALELFTACTKNTGNSYPSSKAGTVKIFIPLFGTLTISTLPDRTGHATSTPSSTSMSTNISAPAPRSQDLSSSWPLTDTLTGYDGFVDFAASDYNTFNIPPHMPTDGSMIDPTAHNWSGPGSMGNFDLDMDWPIYTSAGPA